jgi:hypothetical protein
VVLANEDDASGLASMLAELLRSNINDFRTRAAAAALARGDVVLRATDRGMDVTLSFRRGEVIVTDGQVPAAPVLAGAWLDMAKVCSGQMPAISALAHRNLRVTWGRPIHAVGAAGIALSVPVSFYGDETTLRRRKILLSAVGLGVATTALLAIGRRRRLAQP